MFIFDKLEAVECVYRGQERTVWVFSALKGLAKFIVGTIAYRRNSYPLQRIKG